MRRALAVAAAAVLVAHALAQETEHPPFITTPSEVVSAMLRFAGAGPTDLVVDLGSGDGRIPIAAAAEFGARGLGIELDAQLVEQSRRSAEAAKLGHRVQFVQGDVLHADFSQASVVTVYLLPSLINRLQPRLLDELRPGARIVSHAFAMTGWAPDRSTTLRIARRHPGQGDLSTLHLWVVPAKARGRWAGGGWDVVVHQNFQQIEVDARKDGRPVPVRQASLTGADVEWEMGGARFAGRVEGAEIRGVLAGAPLVLQRR